MVLHASPPKAVGDYSPRSLPAGVSPRNGWFDNLKLRASWGQLGNNSIGNYEWQAVYAATQYVFGNKKVSGLGMSSFSNYDLEWETTSITDFGLDFSVLNSRLTGTIDYYNKVTDGILYKIIGSPGVAFRINIVRCAGQSGNDVQAFPARIAALCLNLCP